MPDYSQAITMQLKEAGSELWLVGERYDELGGSAFYHEILGVVGANVPELRWTKERGMSCGVIDAIHAGCVRAAHDISNGGLITTVAEMMMGGWAQGTLGVDLDLEQVPLGRERASRVRGWPGGPPLLLRLFSESSGFVLEATPDRTEELEAIFDRHGVTAYPVGQIVAEPRLEVKGQGEVLIRLDLDTMKEAWTNGLAEAMR
jgi:phosphoribosylformylglycinamidine synthase